jgi:phosphoribosyl 1,2-cyclic phosphate phosphodiesterase
LSGLDLLVLDALRYQHHPTHFSVGEALAIVERLKPRRAYFTHICHDLGHEAANRALPAGVELAYDGLVVESEIGFR